MNLLQHSTIGQGSNSATSNRVSSSSFKGHTYLSAQGNNISIIYKCSTLNSWIIDSRESDHICSTRSWFHHMTPVTPINVILPNGQFALAKFLGNVVFSTDFSISYVLYILEFSINLISVPKLCQTFNFNVIFNTNNCFIQDSQSLNMIGSAEKIDGLYHLDLHTKHEITSKINNASTHTIPSSALWHFRLGHLSFSRLQALQAKFPFIVVDKQAVCDVCHYSKHKKSPFNNKIIVVSHPFELIHFDVWGPLAIKSYNGHSYFLTVVDDFSRFTWIILMKSKAETRPNVFNFIQLIET